MLATCICLNGSLLDQLSCTIVYLHNLFTCTFGRINMSVCLSVCLSVVSLKQSHTADTTFVYLYTSETYLELSLQLHNL